MKKLAIQLISLPAVILLVSCGGSNTDKQASENTSQIQKAELSSKSQQTGIVGEWEQQYSSFDRNGNYKLEPEEKKPSGTRLGFNWFQFNADGTCLRDKEIRFDGTYTIQEKNGTRKLVIEGGDNLRYTIVELTGNELILGADGGAFIVFSRVK